jgi:aldoxime dehydratase
MTLETAMESIMESTLESAIPSHLRCPRSRQRRVPDDYVPPYPSFVARHASSVTRVVMAYFGIQYGSDVGAAEPALAHITQAFAAADGPGHWDRARWTDATGAGSLVCAAYWDDTARFDAWFSVHGAAWTRTARPGVGTFTEVLRPSVERYETLFSAPDQAEGIAALAHGMSEAVMEHAYWGGARDRIPASQTDAMQPRGAPTVLRDAARVTVKAHDHLCLIRSGQDWGDTDADERVMYVGDVEPTLRAGMDFLRDDGLAIGCIANRYMVVEDAAGRPTDKSYGMSWWKSLAALERWAESHPSHVAIFGAAMKYLSALGPTAKLKFYHEVTVALADEQFFEYLNCSEGTGLLRAA